MVMVFWFSPMCGSWSEGWAVSVSGGGSFSGGWSRSFSVSGSRFCSGSGSWSRGR